METNQSLLECFDRLNEAHDREFHTSKLHASDRAHDHVHDRAHDRGHDHGRGHDRGRDDARELQ